MKAKEPSVSDPIAYDYEMFCFAVGERIRALREERGLSLREMARRYGFHLTQVQRIESGSVLSFKTVLHVAEAFQIPLETLIAGLRRMPFPSKPSTATALKRRPATVRSRADAKDSEAVQR